MKKERPILFSTEMVQAILSGRKTQTRRVVKSEALRWLDRDGFLPSFVADPDNDLCPYGKPGEILWVRETTRRCQHYGFDYEFYQYKDLTTSTHCEIVDKDQIIHDKWIPSIHMRKCACRIKLEVVSVRIERLQDISEDDAKSEGVKTNSINGIDEADDEYWNYNAVDFDDFPCYSAVESFESLWKKINNHEEKPETHWDANPWVWVIEFKKQS